MKPRALFTTSPQMMTVNKLNMPERTMRSFSIIQQVLSESHRSHHTRLPLARGLIGGYLWERLDILTIIGMELE